MCNLPAPLPAACVAGEQWPRAYSGPDQRSSSDLGRLRRHLEFSFFI